MTGAWAGLLVGAAVLLLPPRRRLPTVAPAPADAHRAARPRWLRWLVAPRPPRGADPVVEALAIVSALGPGLRAGLTPVAVVEVLAESDGSAAAGSASLAARLVDAAGAGLSWGEVWAEEAQRHCSPPLRVLAQAWSLSEQAGAPLAVTSESVARMLRASLARRRRLAAALAGPRATMRLLTLLPLAGPVLALSVGADLGVVYGSAAAQASVAAGLALVAAGRLWVSAMVRAVDGGRT